MPVSTISGSALWSLGGGGTRKGTSLYIGMDVSTGFSGSVVLLKKTSGQGFSSVVSYVREPDGVTVFFALSSSVALVVDSSAAEIIASSSISAGSASLFYTHVAWT
jgi:hypothetical protein